MPLVFSQREKAAFQDAATTAHRTGPFQGLLSHCQSKEESCSKAAHLTGLTLPHASSGARQQQGTLQCENP